MPGRRYEAALVKVYRRRMQYIRGANSELAFYSMKSLHYERLHGKRAHQRSMRLNDQFRLILELKEDDAGKTVVVISIEDYH